MAKELTDEEKLKMACQLADTCKMQNLLIELANAALKSGKNLIERQIKEIEVLNEKVKQLTQNN